MILLRGKHKGAEAKLHQAANDWISADGPGGKSMIVNPTSVQLSREEIDELLSCAGGFFWSHYRVAESGDRLVKVQRTR